MAYEYSGIWRYFVPMPYFCYLTIQVDLVNLLTVADKANTLYEDSSRRQEEMS